MFLGLLEPRIINKVGITTEESIPETIMTTLLETTNRVPQIPAVAPVTGDRTNLDNAVAAASEHARRLTALYGTESIDVALAWETYEELRKAQMNRAAAAKTPFQHYCELHPDAPEARCYDL